MPIDYVGTRWSNGMVEENKCVTGFTNLGFVPATSATLFNQALLTLQSSSGVSNTIANAIKDAIQQILSEISAADNDIAP